MSASSKRLTRKPPPEIVFEDEPQLPPSGLPTQIQVLPLRLVGPKSIDTYFRGSYRDRERSFQGISLPLTSPAVALSSDNPFIADTSMALSAPYPAQDLVLNLLVDDRPYLEEPTRHSYHSTLSYHSALSYQSYQSYDDDYHRYDDQRLASYHYGSEGNPSTDVFQPPQLPPRPEGYFAGALFGNKSMLLVDSNGSLMLPTLPPGALTLPSRASTALRIPHSRQHLMAELMFPKPLPGLAANGFDQRLYNYDFSGMAPSEAPESEQYNILDLMDDLLDLSDTYTAEFDYLLLPEIPRKPMRRDGPRGVLLPTHTVLTALLASSGALAVLRARLDEDLPPIPLDLPLLPFLALLLLLQHLAACGEVWLLGNIYAWCVKLELWLHGLSISRREFRVALMKVVVFQRPDIPLEIIWLNVDAMVASLVDQGALVVAGDDEPTVCIAANKPVAGVLADLTPCYAGSHGGMRCYLTHCHLNRVLDHQQRLQHANAADLVLGDDWALYWRLTPEELKLMDRHESKKQLLIFDLFRSEQKFIQRGRCFLEVVCRQFFLAARGLVPEIDNKLLAHFEEQVFRLASELVLVHEQVLFEPLIAILIREGKFVRLIGEISQLYRGWAAEVKTPLLTYMLTVPMIQDLLAKPALLEWLDAHVNNQDKVKRLQVNGLLLFMLTFNSRYQHLPLQLEDLKKQYTDTEPEIDLFVVALTAIKTVALAVNDRKRYADNRYGLTKLGGQLEWRGLIHRPRSLNLELDNRKLFYRGDMLKKGDLRINLSLVHLILLDNFFLVTKRTGKGKFEVTEHPIPVELLLVEERDTSAPLIGRGLASLVPTLSSVSSATSGPGTPVKSPNPNTQDDDEPLTFPFKVRYAGWGKHYNFTFFSRTEQGRLDWIQVFTKARTYLCLKRQKTDPYRVEAVATTQFAYEVNKKITKLPVCAPGDPVYLAAVGGQKKLATFGIKPPHDIYLHLLALNHCCFSKVLCADQVTIGDDLYCFLGTQSGVYGWDYRNKWRKLLVAPQVTKIQVASLYGIVLILLNRQLRYYLLKSLLNVMNGTGATYGNVVSGVKLLSDPVSFFEFGRHRDMNMLFFAKHKTNNSYLFKAMVPEVELGPIFLRFREVKKFYIQADCYGMTLFNTTFAIHTNKGIEIMFLDDLKPRLVPLFPQLVPKLGNAQQAAATIDTIRRMTQKTNLEPLGMYKLKNNTEFLLVYNTCAIFTDKKGAVSRGTMVNFHHKANQVTFDDDKLFVVCDEVIEVWLISHVLGGTNRMMQVILGKCISMLSTYQLTFAMANPLLVGMQMVLNLRRME